MTPLSIDLFIGVGPAVYLDAAKAAEALANTSPVEIGAELFALPLSYDDVSPVTGDRLRRLLADLQDGFANGRLDSARVAQKAIADLIGNTPQRDWLQGMSRVRHAGWTAGGFFATPDRYMFDAAWRRRLRIHTLEKILSKETLPSLLLQAVQKDPVVLQMLRELSEGESECAGLAAYWLQQENELIKLIRADNRLTLAKQARALMEKEYQFHIEQLASGMPATETTPRLFRAVAALVLVIYFLDARGGKRHEDWYENETATRLFHDHVHGHAHTVLSSIEFAEKKHLTLPPEMLRHFLESKTERGLRRMGAEGCARAVLKALFSHVVLFNDIPADIPLAISDAAREIVEDAIGEALHNAVKYADPAKPERWARVQWDAASRAIVIEDNGIGIADVARVGEAGYREQRNDASGTGRGIFMHRRRLAEIGWRMEITSAIGLGTTVKLHLPI